MSNRNDQRRRPAGWYAADYDSSKPAMIIRQVLPHYVLDARIKDIKDRYGQEPKTVRLAEEGKVSLDLGGMVHLLWPRSEFKLGKNRVVGVWNHDAELLASLLESANVQNLQGHDYVRLCTWPYRHTYFSLKDRDKLVKWLKTLT